MAIPSRWLIVSVFPCLKRPAAKIRKQCNPHGLEHGHQALIFGEIETQRHTMVTPKKRIKTPTVFKINRHRI
jgi:hypothetical protein